MAIKVIDDLEGKSSEEVGRHLLQKLKYCQEDKRKLEAVWRTNEQSVFGTHSMSARDILSDIRSDEGDGVTGGDRLQDVNASSIYRSVRYVVSQMSANPPVGTASPATVDPEDRRKANAADKAIRHALRSYGLQELSDLRNLNTVLYGNGFMKSVWDPDAGEPMELDGDSIVMEGDITYSVPSIYDMYIDADARTWPEVRYVFERCRMTYNEAVARWPDKRDVLKQAKKDGTGALYGGNLADAGVSSADPLRRAEPDSGDSDIIYYYEYWEKGLITNRFLGRHALLLENGVLLEDAVYSPHRFNTPRSKLEKAQLPYSLLTDIDVPDSPWGKSNVEYATGLQRTRNKLDQLYLEAIQAHGIPRMVVSENTEISEDSIVQSPWEVLKITSNQPPYFVSPPQMMPDISALRHHLELGMDEAFGINESMLGQASRETSSFVMQYAANQGNTVRIRLFNKYAVVTEIDLRRHLNLIRRHWDTERILQVVGKESVIEVVELKGTDIDGGFDVVVTYGTSLSLDPMTRRQEMIMLAPFFEKAGIPPAQILKMFKLNEIEGLHDRLRIAGERQQEVFEMIIAHEEYVPPRKFQDHANMLAYALDYVMSGEFQTLSEDIKRLIEKHIEERIVMGAEEAGSGAEQELPPQSEEVAPEMAMAPPPEMGMAPMGM